MPVNTAGAAALKAYVEKIDGWEADWIPEADYEAGVDAIVMAADASQDQTPAGRQAAGGAALLKAITAQGYGGKVTADQCNEAAAVVLAAIA